MRRHGQCPRLAQSHSRVFGFARQLSAQHRTAWQSCSQGLKFRQALREVCETARARTCRVIHLRHGGMRCRFSHGQLPAGTLPECRAERAAAMARAQPLHSCNSPKLVWIRSRVRGCLPKLGVRNEVMPVGSFQGLHGAGPTWPKNRMTDLTGTRFCGSYCSTASFSSDRGLGMSVASMNGWSRIRCRQWQRALRFSSLAVAGSTGCRGLTMPRVAIGGIVHETITCGRQRRCMWVSSAARACRGDQAILVRQPPIGPAFKER